MKSPAYRLRENKFVSRQLFLELLQYVDRYKYITNYTYAGLGAASLEDHAIVHARFGLQSLVSIEFDEKTHCRQNFNKPISAMECLYCSTTQHIADLAFERQSVTGNPAPLIYWLDFVKPQELRPQLQDFEALLDLMENGDIARITLNATPASISDGSGMERGALQEHRLEILRERVGEYLPDDIRPEDLFHKTYPQTVVNLIRFAAFRAFASHPNYMLLPCLIDCYQDGQQMVTVTGIVLLRTEVEPFLQRTNLSSWEFFSHTWSSITQIDVPDFSIRERLYYDQLEVGKCHDQRTESLSDAIAGISTDELVKDYQRFRRFYPHFRNITIT